MRIATGVGVEEANGIVYAARMPTGPIVVLRGIAAVIWTEALLGDRAELAGRVASHTDRTASEIAADVDAFASSLVERGLLEPVPG